MAAGDVFGREVFGREVFGHEVFEQPVRAARPAPTTLRR